MWLYETFWSSESRNWFSFDFTVSIKQVRLNYAFGNILWPLTYKNDESTRFHLIQTTSSQKYDINIYFVRLLRPGVVCYAAIANWHIFLSKGWFSLRRSLFTEANTVKRAWFICLANMPTCLWISSIDLSCDDAGIGLLTFLFCFVLF